MFSAVGLSGGHAPVIDKVAISVFYVWAYEPGDYFGVSQLHPRRRLPAVALLQHREVVSQDVVAYETISLRQPIEGGGDVSLPPPLACADIHRADAVGLSNLRQQPVGFAVEEDVCQSSVTVVCAGTTSTAATS